MGGSGVVHWERGGAVLRERYGMDGVYIWEYMNFDVHMGVYELR